MNRLLAATLLGTMLSLGALAPAAMTVLPIRRPDRVLGALTLAWDSLRSADPADLATATEVGSLDATPSTNDNATPSLVMRCRPLSFGGSPGAAGQMLVLSAVFMLMTFVVFAGYGATAALLRDRVLSRPRLVDRIRKTFAASFAVLGARLAVESR